MRSPYTLEDPPPLGPPYPVVEATAWSIAADLWHRHRPDSLLGTECVGCRATWPCAPWVVADGILADVCATSGVRARAAVPALGRHAVAPTEPRRRRRAADPADAETDLLPRIDVPVLGSLPRR